MNQAVTSTQTSTNDPPKVERGKGSEAKRVAERLNGFQYENSNTWRILKEKFSSGVTHSELKSVAIVLCQHTGLSLDRDATRDNRVLIKWFDENWDVLQKHIDNVSLKDENEEIINHSREIATQKAKNE